MSKVSLVVLLSLTKLISQTTSSQLINLPPSPPEVKRCDEINERIKVTFFNDEDFKGCSPAAETLSNRCEHNLGNNTYSSMVVDEPKDTETFCLVLFPTENCVGSHYLVLKNQRRVSQFGLWNDIIRCFRICNEDEKERSSMGPQTTEPSVETIATGSSMTGQDNTQIAINLPQSSSSTNTKHPLVDVEKKVSLRFHQHEGYKGPGHTYNVQSDGCINLGPNKFSSVKVITPKSTCIELFNNLQCRSKQTLKVKEDTPTFGLFNDSIMSLRRCSAKV